MTETAKNSHSQHTGSLDVILKHFYSIQPVLNVINIFSSLLTIRKNKLECLSFAKNLQCCLKFLSIAFENTLVNYHLKFYYLSQKLCRRSTERYSAKTGSVLTHVNIWSKDQTCPSKTPYIAHVYLRVDSNN